MRLLFIFPFLLLKVVLKAFLKLGCQYFFFFDLVYFFSTRRIFVPRSNKVINCSISWLSGRKGGKRKVLKEGNFTCVTVIFVHWGAPTCRILQNFRFRHLPGVRDRSVIETAIVLRCGVVGMAVPLRRSSNSPVFGEVGVSALTCRPQVHSIETACTWMLEQYHGGDGVTENASKWTLSTCCSVLSMTTMMIFC